MMNLFVIKPFLDVRNRILDDRRDHLVVKSGQFLFDLLLRFSGLLKDGLQFIDELGLLGFHLFQIFFGKFPLFHHRLQLFNVDRIALDQGKIPGRE